MDTLLRDTSIPCDDAAPSVESPSEEALEENPVAEDPDELVELESDVVSSGTSLIVPFKNRKTFLVAHSFEVGMIGAIALHVLVILSIFLVFPMVRDEASPFGFFRIEGGSGGNMLNMVGEQQNQQALPAMAAENGAADPKMDAEKMMEEPPQVRAMEDRTALAAPLVMAQENSEPVIGSGEPWNSPTFAPRKHEFAAAQSGSAERALSAGGAAKAGAVQGETGDASPVMGAPGDGGHNRQGGDSSLADLVGKLKPPLYPASLKRRGIEGHLELTFELGADGSVVKVFVSKTSGYEQFDNSALEAAREWRLPPEHPIVKAVLASGQPIVRAVNFEIDKRGGR